MKRLFGLILFFGFTTAVFSQINVVGNHTVVSGVSGVNNVYIFDKIDNSSEIHYKSQSETSVVKWYIFLNGAKNEMTNVSVLSSTETYIDPVNNTGYILEVDGQQIASFWVFDYSQYLPLFNSVTAIDSDAPCDEVKLNVDATISVFNYQSPTGAIYKLDRKFTVTYTTLEWNSDSKEWKEIASEETVVLPKASDLLLPIPYTNTTFTVSGDDFASLLGLSASSVTSATYITKAVKCNITSKTSTVRKDILNEKDRPTEDSQLTGSAPLDIDFFSNPTPTADTYIWKIFKDNSTSPLISRSAKDNTYPFTEAGKYTVTATTSNAYCSFSDTVFVEVSESSLVVPKVFTPNDDDVQDEFKVAYRSIIKFNGLIVNRWGRKVFSWTDPGKGWNGKIGNKQAAEGTYFYIITAKGSEGKEYKLKGYVTLLR
ncbi:MAG: gliding motility-associated C-terminal domain-containing protein [Paludibacteraceae bacterium]